MEVKKDILWRVYLCYILMVVVCIAIFGKAVYIQQFQGEVLRNMSDSLHQRIEEIEAERGTIYSEDGQMLSTSIPQFDVYIDFAADGLREKSGARFRENVDSLSVCLAALFKDKSASAYKKMLEQGYRKKDRYLLLQKNISYRSYQSLKTFPLVRLGRNKSGFITEDKTIRLNPYKVLAYRTIGLDRENAQKIGLEKTYDTLLKGTTGKRLVRYIAGGVSVPVDDFQVEPENGKDIVTTLDVFIQEVTENALMKMMVQNEAVNGCAIVMETKTGKIKAIANLGRRPSGVYSEDFNYAISPSEPGSTFKLATMIALLEDKKINLNTLVNLEGGTWQIAGRTVFDSEQHGRRDVTVKQAFELSSNVGMAKLASANYGSAPSQFIRHLKKLRLDTLTGIDITGERKAVIHKPGTKYWSATTLPWMSFGYNITVTPLQTAVLYNAIANNGSMVRPYLLNAVKEEGVIIKQQEPTIIDNQICSKQTLQKVKLCLEGVCTDGTAKELFKDSPYKVAGKTGTSLVADGVVTYADKVYQTSFAGYFPAENPQYTIVVVIRNKPGAVLHYGATVAGPVFKEIANRLYTNYVKHSNDALKKVIKDSSVFTAIVAKDDVAHVFKKLNIPYTVGGSVDDWVTVNGSATKANMTAKSFETKTMPLLKGMGLKDVVVMCETIGLKVLAKGKGKVAAQSINAGETIAKGQIVNIELN